jgi:hypothetical protein
MGSIETGFRTPWTRSPKPEGHPCKLGVQLSCAPAPRTIGRVKSTSQGRNLRLCPYIRAPVTAPQSGRQSGAPRKSIRGRVRPAPIWAVFIERPEQWPAAAGTAKSGQVAAREGRVRTRQWPDRMVSVSGPWQVVGRGNQRDGKEGR